jgi:uncharacterized protein (DUF433 family)
LLHSLAPADRLSGAFNIKSLFDHLEAGDSIEQFLEGFPSVKREQIIVLLEEAREHEIDPVQKPCST